MRSQLPQMKRTKTLLRTTVVQADLGAGWASDALRLLVRACHPWVAPHLSAGDRPAHLTVVAVVYTYTVGGREELLARGYTEQACEDAVKGRKQEYSLASWLRYFEEKTALTGPKIGLYFPIN